MARSLDPKCKKCRRENEKLFLKGERCFSPKCAMVKRNYPPGLHGPKRQSRPTQYGMQLREKQKVKKIYGVLEKQFRNYYTKAARQSGNASENLLRLLEMRLDNVVYRLGLASSRNLARQLVSHGHLCVNNKKVTIPSYQVKVGDKISVKPGNEQTPLFRDFLKASKKRDLPDWLELNELEGKVTSLPKLDEIMQSFNMSLIIEFYSR